MAHWAKGLFLLVAVLLFTNAKILVAYYLGLRSVTSTYFLFLPLLGICLAMIPKTAGEVLKKGVVLAWVGIILAIPTFITALHFLLGFVGPRDALFIVGKAFYFAVLLVTCVTYCAKWPELRGRFYLLAIVVIIAGVIAELVAAPAVLTIKHAMLADPLDSMNESYQRGTGLFLNPNLLGMACVLWLIGLLGSGKHISTWGVVGIIASVLSVLMSGSRTSLVILLVVALLFAWLRIKSTRSLNEIVVRSVAISVMVVTTLLVVGVASKFVGSQDQWVSTLDRLERLPQVMMQVSKTDDGSVRARFDQMDVYVEQVWDGALIGRSPRYPGQMIAEGTVRHASQNTFIDYAIAYGVPFALLLLAAWIALYRRARRVQWSDPSAAVGVKVFVVASCLTALSVDFMLAIEPYVIALGVQLCIFVSVSRERGRMVAMAEKGWVVGRAEVQHTGDGR